MGLFKLGDWVIDTKTHESVDVIAIIPAGKNSIKELYVLCKDDGSYYIADSTYLIMYDRYYWDELAEQELAEDCAG